MAGIFGIQWINTMAADELATQAGISRVGCVGNNISRVKVSITYVKPVWRNDIQ